MNSHYDVIVYGTICLDLIWRVERLPCPGGGAEIQDERTVAGGEAVNTAIALSRWGVKVALVGNALGDDDHGRLLRQSLARDAPDLDTRFIITSSEAHTPFCLCIATPDGHRTMFGRWFHEMHGTPLDESLLRTARAFTVNPCDREADLAACRLAARARLPIIAMDYTWEPEVNRLASMVVTSSENVARDQPPEALLPIAASLRDAHGVTAIVTCGADGCVVAEKGTKETAHIPAYVAPEMVDPTGSGDVFRAGLVYGQLQGWDLQRSVEFACATGALNCGAMGGWCGVRSLEETEQFLRTAPRHRSP